MPLSLNDDETLKWEGTPPQGIVFSSRDVLLVPLSLVFLGFSVFWTYHAIGPGVPVFFTLWGSGFVLFSLYLALGRFVHDVLDRRRTQYAVTDRRVIITRGRSAESIALGQWSALKLIERSDGTGDILFGEPRSFFGGFAAYGYLLSSRLGTSGFYGIAKARSVFELLQQH